MNGSIQVFFVNNDGGGFADYVETPEGTTVGQFFSRQMSGRNPASYYIRVNQLAVPSGQLLQNRDRVSVTPVGVKGASR